MPSSPIISVDALAQRLQHAEPPTVLDVRWTLQTGADRAAYDAGHIPGAVFVDLHHDLAGPPGPGRGRHPLPDPERFEEAMRAAWVSNERAVVAYDATDGAAAARAWWLLRFHGHGDVAVLDGGLRAWTEAGQPLATDEPSPTPGNFAAHPGAMPTLTAAQAAELARTGVLLDARAPERFRGEREPVDPVAGHIPGARNRPHTANMQADGRLRPGAEIRHDLAELGVDSSASLGVERSASLGVYCGSGITAAHEVLALAHAGLTAALYPGSWSEWITDPARPVATGE